MRRMMNLFQTQQVDKRINLRRKYFIKTFAATFQRFESLNLPNSSMKFSRNSKSLEKVMNLNKFFFHYLDMTFSTSYLLFIAFLNVKNKFYKFFKFSQ